MSSADVFDSAPAPASAEPCDFKDAVSIGLAVPQSWLGNGATQIAQQNPQSLNTLRIAGELVAAQAAEVKQASAGAPAPPSGGGDDSHGEITAKEKAIRDALSKGGFDMTGVVGKYWQQAKKSDAALKEEYESLGKNYAKQRAFRQKWLATALEEFSKTKTKTETHAQVNENQGTFEPFDIIVDREGGEHRPQAVAAALNYTLACIKFHELGQTVGSTGTPWMSFNVMTQRWEFMYLKKTYRDWFSTSWTLAITQKSTPAIEEPEPSASASGEASVVDDAAADPETPQKALPPQPAGKAKAKAKAGAGGKPLKRELPDADPEPETPEMVAAKRAKKESDLFFRKLKSMKVEMGTAISTANDILGLIARDASWSWAAGPASQTLKQARQQHHPSHQSSPPNECSRSNLTPLAGVSGWSGISGTLCTNTVVVMVVVATCTAEGGGNVEETTVSNCNGSGIGECWHTCTRHTHDASLGVVAWPLVG
jgi:hypothetical protein